MDSEKPCQTLNVGGFAHAFANLENAERHARAVARHLQPIEIWQDGEMIARVSADAFKRTRMRMLSSICPSCSRLAGLR